MQIEYIPYILREIDEFKALTGAGDQTNSDIQEAIRDLKNNQYISDATESGIEKYERPLRISPLDSDTIFDRRFRVLTKYNQQLPYTERGLRNLLDTLVGKDGYTLQVDSENRKITARVELSAKSMLKTVGDLLENYVPMNFIIDLSLIYNQYGKLEVFTYEQLQQYTHEQLREDNVK